MNDGGNLETLPDYLRPGLRVISIGLNPSLLSVQQRIYFANPRNRFWRALNKSQLIPVSLTPGVPAQKLLCEQYGIGFTDVVKRATATASALKAEDFRKWAPVLTEKIMKYKPGIAWFHGKVAYGRYLKAIQHPAGEEINWGLQHQKFGESRVFVTPNPSPANAVYSLTELVSWYRKLAEL